jgi:hypothetical protein
LISRSIASRWFERQVRDALRDIALAPEWLKHRCCASRRVGPDRLTDECRDG